MSNPKEDDLKELLEKKRQCDEKIRKLQKWSSNEIEENRNNTVTNPVYDLYVCKQFLYIDLELPGVPEHMIPIKTDPQFIRIFGTFPILEDVKEEDFLIKMRQTGSFDYKFAIPYNKIVKDYSTKLISGVLHLKIELTEGHDSFLSQEKLTTHE